MICNMTTSGQVKVTSRPWPDLIKKWIFAFLFPNFQWERGRNASYCILQTIITIQLAYLNSKLMLSWDCPFNHYGRSCDVTRFKWCVLSWVLLYCSGADWMFMWAVLLHTYWDWVSMLMLMLLERIIYFVFVFRMLLPFFYFSYK